MNFKEWVDNLFIKWHSSVESNLKTEKSHAEIKEFITNQLTNNEVLIKELTTKFKCHIQSQDEFIENLIQDGNVPKEYRKYCKR
jgi:hypothetical protein